MNRHRSQWIGPEDVRLAARRALPRTLFDFIDGGATDETTMRANRAAFDEITLRPRVLVDVSSVDLRTTFLGRERPSPIICAPTGMSGLAHPGGESAGARAAGSHGCVFALSTGSSHSVQEVRRASKGALWFQLYAWRDRELSRDLIDLARGAGCEALIFTVDTPLSGRRERDLRNGLTIPPRLNPRTVVDLARHPRWLWGLQRGRAVTMGNLAQLNEAPQTGGLGLAAWLGHLFNTKQTWDDLEWIAGIWDGPVLVKGIQTGDDASRAVANGATGIIVSNHGGRQLDGTRAAVQSLPEVVEAVGGSKVDVFVDGGIRRGTDVIKCLALGAAGVLVGRPWLYGLAAAGEEGVRRVLSMLHDETTNALALLGCPRVRDLNPDYLQPG